MQILNSFTSVAAVLLALWILYEARREFIVLRVDSRQLTHDLEVAGMVLEHVRDREEFADSFPITSSQLLELEIFGPVWDEFRESLVVDEEERVVRSARDPYEFLGPRLLDASEVDQRRIEAVPNRLIAFGLIFTFLGLMLSLVIAGFGLSTDSLPQMRATLNALLFAAALKFITSIAGIFSSIVFIHKRSELLNTIDARSAAIGRQLDRLTVPLRADIVAEASYKELARQSHLLESGQQELANAIATQLDATLRANLADAVKPVADRIGEMGQTIAKMNQDALNNMVAQFSRELGGAARDHADRLERSMYQLETTMKGVPESIQKASEAIEKAGKAFGEASEAAIAATELRLTQAGDTFAELLTETEKNLGAAGVALAQVATLLTGMVDRIEQTEAASSDRAQRAEETLRLAVEQISRVLERADTAAEGLAQLTPLAQRLEQVGGSLFKANEINSALIARSEEMLATSRSAGDVLSRTAASYSESTARLQVSLTSVFEQIAAGIDLFRSRLEETVEQLDEDAARIADRLSGGNGGSPPADA